VLTCEDDAALSRAMTAGSLEDRRDDVVEVVWVAVRDRQLVVNRRI
jgi:hypothetical protein